MMAKKIVIAAVIALGISVTSNSTSVAQHPHHHHGGAHRGGHHHAGVVTHRSGFHLVSPHGTHVTGHLDDYHYVVPSTHHHGSFYNYEGAHYYTPPVTTIVVGRPTIVQKPVVQKPVAMEFGSFAHFEPLAERLEVVANELCLDLHHNYHHNANFREVYREAYQLLSTAKYLHDSEHRSDRRAITREAGSLDALFHHVAGEVRNWSREEHRRIGSMSVPARLEEMEALIHHLLYDIGVKPAHDVVEAAPPPAAEAAPPPDGGVAPRPGGGEPPAPLEPTPAGAGEPPPSPPRVR